MNETGPTPTTTTASTNTNETTEATSTISMTTSPTTPTTTSDIVTTTIAAPTATSDDSMPLGGLIGIIAGSCLVIFVVVLALFMVYRRRKRKRSKPREVPKLPSALDVKTFQVNLQNTEDSTNEAENPSDPSMYQNIDSTGNPRDETNPNVGDDGYLKKGQKKKKKKKRKDKFDKKKKRHAETNDGFSPSIETRDHEQGTRDHEPGTRDQKTGSALSDMGYTEGRPADGVIEMATGANKHQFYENTDGLQETPYQNIPKVQDEGFEEYYNIQGEHDGHMSIYENTRGRNS